MSIYDSIGGAPAIRAAVDDFYARVLADARLAPFFTGTDLHRLKAHQRTFIAAAVGGPEIFAGRNMASAHAGLGIGDGDFDAVVGHLAGTLTGLGVPEGMIGQIGGALAPLRDDIVTTPSLPTHHLTSSGGCDREPPHGWIDGRRGPAGSGVKGPAGNGPPSGRI